MNVIFGKTAIFIRNLDLVPYSTVMYWINIAYASAPFRGANARIAFKSSDFKLGRHHDNADLYRFGIFRPCLWQSYFLVVDSWCNTPLPQIKLQTGGTIELLINYECCGPRRNKIWESHSTPCGTPRSFDRKLPHFLLRKKCVLGAGENAP